MDREREKGEGRRGGGGEGKRMTSSVSDSGGRVVVWGRGVDVRGLCCCWFSPLLSNEEIAADGLDTPTASSSALDHRARASPRFTRRILGGGGLPSEERNGEEGREKKRERASLPKLSRKGCLQSRGSRID
jgi:hypothetical protein